MYVEAADAFVPERDAPGPTPLAEATAELYLRLAALDPDDPSELGEFMSAYGGVDLLGRYWTSWSDLGGLPVRADEVPELDAAIQRAAAVFDDIATMSHAETRTEIRYAILMMRDAITARRCLEEGLDPGEQTWEAPFYQANIDHPSNDPTGLLSAMLDQGLTPFSPHIRTFPEGGEPAPLWAGDASTWNVCCLELFNHIVEQAEYKLCANETCGRLFVRQGGRAEHGQHRTTGVMYCTASCARSQAQRAYRRRKRDGLLPAPKRL